MGRERSEGTTQESGLTRIHVWTGWPFHAGQFDVILPTDPAPEPRAMYDSTQAEGQAQPGNQPTEQNAISGEVILLGQEDLAVEG